MVGWSSARHASIAVPVCAGASGPVCVGEQVADPENMLNTSIGAVSGLTTSIETQL